MMSFGGRPVLIVLSFVLGVFASGKVLAAELFLDFDRLQVRLGFTPFYSLPSHPHPLKVAVLDLGFSGYQSAIGQTLPSNTQYHAGPLAPRSGTERVEHGRVMAEIFTQLVTDQGRSRIPIVSELHLYNVSGFTNFKAAIDDVIARKIDLVLYSEVWPIGGNGDGHGFVNAQVNRATQAGVIWINAAGNFATRTYGASVDVKPDGFLKLSDLDDSLRITCEIPEGVIARACPVQIFLVWNDFKDQEGIGTDKDLDLVLLDDGSRPLKVSALKQTTRAGFRDPQFTNYPRELISGELELGTYYLKIRKSGGEFSSQARFRVLLDGDFVTLSPYSTEETLLNPADNSTVVTVGALDSERSSQSLSLSKPDLLAPSSLILKDSKLEYRGSSNAAAIVAAGFALLKAHHPEADRATLLRATHQEPSKIFFLTNGTLGSQ